MSTERVRFFAWWIIIYIFFTSLVFASQDKDSSKDLFPKPKSLEDAVQFWIKVYTKYNTNDYIIHDSRNLSIIYEVVRWGSLDELDVPQTKAQRRFLKNKQKEYRSLLLNLASSEIKPDALSIEEKRIFNLFNQTTDRHIYRRAANQIRVQKGQRNRFLNGMEISGRYMNYIKKIFEKYDLPRELTVLPHVESSFNYRAYSSAGAAGMWQFTRYTGRRFLKINYEIDERLDPILATDAAARLLKQNYEELGSWPLAITAYNHGLQGMKRAQRRLKTDDISTIIARYRSRYFKFASRNFYCEFLAALHVVNNYKTYFGEVDFEKPIQFTEFELPHYLKFKAIVDYFQIEREDLQKYNPSLRNPIFRGSKYLPKGYKLRLPSYLNPDILYAQIPPTELFVAQKQNQWYRVRAGDTLSRIARRSRTSVSVLVALNDISNAHRIHIGDVLRLPDKTELNTIKQQQQEEPVIAALSPQKSETLVGTSESNTTTTTPSEISKTIKPAIDIETEPISTKLTLPSEIELKENSNPQVGYIRVEPDETLGHYAEWLNIPTQKIRNWNGFSYGENIHLDQKIKLVFETVNPGEFNAVRLEYHRGIEEDFFSNYKVIGTNTHRVKSGENIWYLCNYVYNLPYWLIRSYNSDVNLESLKPGDLILIPEISGEDPNI